MCIYAHVILLAYARVLLLCMSMTLIRKELRQHILLAYFTLLHSQYASSTCSGEGHVTLWSCQELMHLRP